MIQNHFNRRTIVTNILTLFSGSAVAQGMTAGMLVLTARQLGPEQYGQYSGVISLATFCSILFTLGLDLWILQEGNRQTNRIGELSGSILASEAMLGLIWMLGLFIIAPWITTSALPTHLIRLAGLVIWCSSLFNTILTSFKSILKNKVSASLETGVALIRLLTTFGLITIGASLAVQFMWAQAGVMFLSVLVALLLTNQFLKLGVNRSIIRTTLAKSPPFAASMLLAMLFMRLDLLIIAFMLDDHATGIYSPAVSILNAAFLVPTAVHYVIVPVLSNLFTQDIKQAWLTAGRAIALLGVIGLGLFIVLVGGAQFLPLLLGQAYTQSKSVLQILSVIIVFQSINYGIAAILLAANLQTKRAIVQAITVAVNLILNLLAVRRFGIMGVAVVYVISELVLLSGYSWIAMRYYYQTRAPRPSQNA